MYTSHLRAPNSLSGRIASMLRMRPPQGRALVGLSAAGALAMAAFICLTAHALG
jgi:hypothetical protein